MGGTADPLRDAAAIGGTGPTGSRSDIGPGDPGVAQIDAIVLRAA
jgi:hypothetical protein